MSRVNGAELSAIALVLGIAAYFLGTKHAVVNRWAGRAIIFGVNIWAVAGFALDGFFMGPGSRLFSIKDASLFRIGQTFSYFLLAVRF